MLPQPLSNSTELICQQALELQSFGHMKHQIHPFLIPFPVSADWEQVLAYLWEARKGQICTAHVGLAVGAWDLDLDLSSSTPLYAQVGTSRLTLCWGCSSCLLSFAVDHQGAKSYTSGLGLWSTSFFAEVSFSPFFVDQLGPAEHWGTVWSCGWQLRERKVWYVWRAEPPALLTLGRWKTDVKMLALMIKPS